jgi:hypothetical protein
MEILLKRIKQTSEETLGKLYINGVFECYTIEDEHHDVKIKHDTRIPAGRYEIKLRTFGGFHENYKVKFKDIHKGMLWLQDVPGFGDILIHIGNTEKDSSGCILVNAGYMESENGRIVGTSSVLAYKKMYPKVAKALASGEKVWITIQNEA